MRGEVSVRNVARMDCLHFRSRTSSSKDVVRANALARGGLSARSTTVSGSASKPGEQWSWRSNSESPESDANLRRGREGREDAAWVSAALVLNIVIFFLQQRQEFLVSGWTLKESKTEYRFLWKCNTVCKCVCVCKSSEAECSCGDNPICSTGLRWSNTMLGVSLSRSLRNEVPQGCVLSPLLSLLHLALLSLIIHSSGFVYHCYFLTVTLLTCTKDSRLCVRHDKA